MSKLLDDLTDRFKQVYCFYVFGNDFVAVKKPGDTKYFVNKGFCTCRGFESRRKCKHTAMISGVWTDPDGTRDWLWAELGDILPISGIEDPFSTAILRTEHDFGYPFACFTVKRDKFFMGVELRGPLYTEDFVREMQRITEEAT